MSNASTATIAINASLSGAVALTGKRRLAGVRMPAAWTAASITFEVSTDDVTYQQLHYGSGVYTITSGQGAAANASFSLDPAAFAGWPFVKIRSGTTASAVLQLAERALTVVTRAA